MTPRTALITGASRGLGHALATALAGQGWRVVVDARDAERLHAAFGTSDRVTAIPGDVTDLRHRTVLAEAVGPRLDLLINNASELGPSPLPPLADLRTDDLRRVLDVNVVAPLALVQAVLPALRASGGTVVDISSDAAVEAYAGWGGARASKAAPGPPPPRPRAGTPGLRGVPG